MILAGLLSGLDNVSNIENCLVALTVGGRFGGRQSRLQLKLRQLFQSFHTPLNPAAV
jgi:hypothetical protein